MGVIYDESGCGSGMGEDPAPSTHVDVRNAALQEAEAIVADYAGKQSPIAAAIRALMSSPSPQAHKRGVLSDLLKLIEAMPKTDRGFSWEARDWQGNEAIRAYNENAKVLKFLLDNTEQVAADIRAALTTEGQPGPKEHATDCEQRYHSCTCGYEKHLEKIAAEICQ
jgi:hypothetical protein